MPKVNILGVHVDVIGKEGLHDAIRMAVLEKRKEVLAYVNVHAINLAQSDEQFRNFLNSPAVLYCDGEGVRLASRILGKQLPPRIVLTYWIWELCELCEREGFSMFFLGGTEENNTLAVSNLQARFRNLKIAGRHHGYFEKWNNESDTVIGMINTAMPDILFVGFGMPLQERWIDANLPGLNVHVVLPAGSMIEYTAGRKSFAPAWMANHGMEWIYRLFQEPGRLWKRYIIGNPLFLFRVLLQYVKQGKQY